jgi:hypothetical protein
LAYGKTTRHARFEEVEVTMFRPPSLARPALPMPWFSVRYGWLPTANTIRIAAIETCFYGAIPACVLAI